MVHENHPVSSPAHRRSQNPLSPSASVFRRSTNFLREETDLSWMALIRRHRFLLSMLALLMLLCTIYLYFAIKLGPGDCSGLVGKEEASCQLKKSQAKMSHGHKSLRKLMSIRESLDEVQNHHEVGKVKTVLIWGCIRDDIVNLLNAHKDISTVVSDCQVLMEGNGKVEVDHKIGSKYSLDLFNSIPCDNCTVLQLQLIDDQSMLWDMQYLFQHEGYFFSIFDDSTELGFEKGLSPNVRLNRSNALKLL